MRFFSAVLQAVFDFVFCQLYFYIFHDSLNFKARIFFSGNIIIFLLLSSLYSFNNWNFWNEAKLILRSLFYAFIISTLFILTAKTGLNFIYLLFFFLAFMVFTLTTRYLLFSCSMFCPSAVIIGAGEVGKIFADSLNLQHFRGRKIIGFLDDDDEKQGKIISGLPVLGKIKDAENFNADEVIIAIPQASSAKLFQNYKRVYYIPDMYMLTTHSAEIRNIDSLTFISSQQNLLNPIKRIISNIINYAGAAAAMILFSLFMFFTALRIKLEDGGNILFRHLRIGRDLKNFYMYKFRTMIPDAEKVLQEMLKDEKLKCEFEEAFKFKHDPRVTKYGSFLRRTSLDELPQIFNVFKGEMNLTGPRPIVEKEIELYYGHKTAKQIFRVKPGMTGLWQVSGRNDVENYKQRIDFDLYYIHNWSVWLDIIIILRTAGEVLKGTGAY